LQTLFVLSIHAFAGRLPGMTNAMRWGGRVMYLVPRTAVLGAVLLTGYLGGAVATHVRVGGDPFPVVFPVVLGALLWGGLVLQDPRLRALLPVRSPSAGA
jgi:hypothetical protein